MFSPKALALTNSFARMGQRQRILSPYESELPMQLRGFLAAVCVASVGRGEMLPSFDLPSAARYASHVLLVQDGTIVESWKGGLPEDRRFPGSESSPQPVVYGLDRVHGEFVLAELKRRGLAKVEKVSGKRMVHFL